jgi:hypothetical protein
MSWCLRCDGCGTTRSIGALSEIADVASGWLLDRGQGRDLCPACIPPSGEPTVINCKVGALVAPVTTPP